MILWQLWLERNNFTHDNHCHNPKTILEDVGLKLVEFQRVSNRVAIKPASSRPSSRHWTAPQAGSLCLNVDAAVSAKTGCIGLEPVIRDSAGNDIGVSSVKREYLVEPLAAELLAIREGLCFAKMNHLSIQVIQSDSLIAIRAVMMSSD